MHVERTEGDGHRVWLSDSDIDRLLDVPDDPTHELAYALGCRCGLRSHEITQVRPSHLKHDDTIGDLLQVPEGKGARYRETPIPTGYARQIETVAKYQGGDGPVVDVSTRSLRNWIERDRAELAEATDDQRWHHVSMHDLRRSWAGQLRAASAEPPVVLEWGGWSDMDTFLDHYRGATVPEVQREERAKVPWL